MRLKNDDINKKSDLNKAINITKKHKKNNAKNKQVSIILNFNKQTLETITQNPRVIHAHAPSLKCNCGG